MTEQEKNPGEEYVHLEKLQRSFAKSYLDLAFANAFVEMVAMTGREAETRKPTISLSSPISLK